MLGISLPETFEGASSFLVVKTINMIEPLRRVFQELRCFQTLRERWIRSVRGRRLRPRQTARKQYRPNGPDQEAQKARFLCVFVSLWFLIYVTVR